MKVASASFGLRLLRCKAARAQRHADGWPAARAAFCGFDWRAAI
jgi:hypothetical protein